MVRQMVKERNNEYKLFIWGLTAVARTRIHDNKSFVINHAKPLSETTTAHILENQRQDKMTLTWDC